MSSQGEISPPAFPAPDIARVHDYALGGKDNYPPDRQLYEEILAFYPGYGAAARANRRFLRRSVDVLGRRGVRQFIDLGSGIPTSPNVHEVARVRQPDARVVYSDHNTSASVHGRALLAQHTGVEFVETDVRDIDHLLGSDEVRRLIVPDQPVAILAYAVLHFFDDEAVRRLLDRLVRWSPRGSLLAFSILAVPQEDTDRLRLYECRDEVATRLDSQPVIRTPEQAASLFGSLTLSDPGLVDIQDWPTAHPDPEPDLFFLGALAHLG